MAVGAERAVRHTERIDDAARRSPPSGHQEFLERAIEEIQLTRTELELNPQVELAAEALLVRLENARRGAPGRLVAHGRRRLLTTLTTGSAADAPYLLATTPTKEVP